MTERLKIVTDSASSLPRELARQNDIDVIPNSILFKAEIFRDGIDLDTKQLIDLMRERNFIPSTGVSPIGEYLQVYDRYPDQHILSIHLIGNQSGVFNAARIAATYREGKVDVYDSETVSMGIGFMALKAAELSSKGASLKVIREKLDDMKSKTTVIAAIDSLEHLRKGGRVRAIEGLIAMGLRIKPIVKFENNEVFISDKVRTRARSLDRLVEITRAVADNGIDQVAVLHADAINDALRVAENIKDFYKGDVNIYDCGAVLAIQAGPSVVGVAVVRK